MKIDTEILCSFIDGDLDEQTAQTVRAALETDQTLRREYEGLCKTAQLVRSLPRVSAPPELAATITAHAERSQLLGPTEPGQSRPSRLRWTLSIAASLLVGASLGILGYRAWPGPVAPSRPPSESAVTTAAKDARRLESPLPALAYKKTPSPKPGRDLNEAALKAVDWAGEEIATGLPIRGTKTGYAAKAGPRIARTGLAKGPPSRSLGADFDAAADALVTNGQSLENEQIQEAAAGIAVQSALLKRKAVPLERQVLSNNYINQGMAENLKFEAEPLNVKVVSNDSAKTLQFVQQWAMKNSLIDFNKAPAKLNFPAYTQVVFQGKPGTNTEVDTKNSIFVRTTRRQAQEIVEKLQRQKPVVISVSVKDDKKLLATLAPEPDWQQAEAFYQPRGFAYQEEDADKKRDLALKSRLAESAYQKRLRTPANGYLYDLSNQAQVISLEDLVTLVVLVEDAPLAVKTKAAPPATPQPTESPLPEGNTESK